ncbi:MAG TPA: MFS transporter, partial [Candidatus Dormibacteraeota bacterium]|nr:MFS transporter [Candidatus Dormibacteraeota bacterium]
MPPTPTTGSVATDAAPSEPGPSVISKLLWRLLPFLFLLYVVAYLDRINVGFAALQMRQELGFSDDVYGIGSGIFFAGYFLFQLPSNLALQRVGARRWIALLMILWGCISASNMLVTTPRSFYTLRFLLGAAEAGFFPGMILYFRSWFPADARARVVAMFMTAGPVSGIIGGPISGALLGLHHVQGLSGWQWLFLLEGLPAVILGLLAFFVISDRPENAKWLAPEQRSWLATTLREEDQTASALSQSEANETSSANSSTNPSSTGRVAEILTNGRLWLFAFVYFGLNTCAYGVSLWLPVALRSLTGISNFRLGLLSTIPYATAAVIMVILGIHSDRTGERRWHVAIAAGIAAVALCFAGYATNVTWLIVAFSVAMIGVQSMNGPFWAMPSKLLSSSAAAAG